MAYRFRFDYSDLRKAVNNFNSVKEIDVIKEVNWYLNQVYRDLSRKHGKRYTYVTPSAPERKNLRVRSRTLLNNLKASRFTRQNGNSVTAGWDIPTGNPKGNYLGVHVGETESDAPFRLTPQNAKYTYTTKKGEKRILIPLRAGMDSQGRPKPITGRIRANMRAAPFRVIEKRSDFVWGGEDKKKFHANTVILYRRSGRKKVPMYVIVKKARIPKRLLLGPAMDKHADAFYDRLESQIQKQLDRISK